MGTGFVRKLGYKVIYHGETDAFEFINNKIYDAYLDDKGRECIFMGDGDRYYGFKQNGEFEIVSEEKYRELKKLPIYQKHNCPVCGRGVFSMQESFEHCKVCGWTDGFEMWCNYGITVEECKELYQQGKLEAGWEYVQEMVKGENQGSHACPICWKTQFSKWDSQEKCPHCGWIDDWVQDKYEDKDGLNKMCRKDYKKAYKQGTIADYMSKEKHEYVRFHGESEPLIYFVDGWLYQKLAETHGFWRVIDETGEDYLYLPGDFEIVDISDEEFKKEKAKQAKIKKLWDEVSSLYYECKKIDDGVNEYYDSDSVKMLEKKKKVLQALLDGKKPEEIGQDYWEVLELKK